MTSSTPQKCRQEWILGGNSEQIHLPYVDKERKRIEREIAIRTSAEPLNSSARIDLSKLFPLGLASSSSYTMFGLAHTRFMSPLPISATRPAADHAPVDYSVSFIRPHLRSSTSHPPSCNFDSFPNSRQSPSSVVTRASTSKMVGEGEEDGCGLGIVQFLRDKNLLITGATGFVGKGTKTVKFCNLFDR